MSAMSKVAQMLSLYWGIGAVISLVCLVLWFKFMMHVHYLYRFDQASDNYYRLRRLSHWVCVVFLCLLALCASMALYSYFHTTPLPDL